MCGEGRALGLHMRTRSSVTAKKQRVNYTFRCIPATIHERNRNLRPWIWDLGQNKEEAQLTQRNHLSFKVIDVDANRKFAYDLLLLITETLHRISSKIRRSKR